MFDCTTEWAETKTKIYVFPFSFWLKNLQMVNQLIPLSGSTDWLLSSGEFTCWFTCSQILTKLYLNSETADSEHIHTVCLFLLQAHKPHRREWTDSPLSESHPGGKTPEHTWTYFISPEFYLEECFEDVHKFYLCHVTCPVDLTRYVITISYLCHVTGHVTHL